MDSVHGILQARILERVAMPSSRGIFPTQGSKPCLLTFPALAGEFFTTSATWEDKYYDITYKWSIKYDTYELIDKTDTDSQTQKTNV